MRNILITVLMAGGLFFFLVGTLGMLRLPDVMTRIHSAAKCDTLGALLCISALLLYSDGGFIAWKLVLVIAFLWITAPTASHLIAKVEYKSEQQEEEKLPIHRNEVKEDGDI